MITKLAFEQAVGRSYMLSTHAWKAWKVIIYPTQFTSVKNFIAACSTCVRGGKRSSEYSTVTEMPSCISEVKFGCFCNSISRVGLSAH